MIAAFVGLLAVTGATRYLPKYSSKPGAAAPRHPRNHGHARSAGDRVAAANDAGGAGRLTAVSDQDSVQGSIEVVPARPAETIRRD
jgi:hypothetical protein